MADPAALDAVLDAGLVCHLSFVRDGRPMVIPTCYGRDEHTLYLHGSTGAGNMLDAARGIDIAVAVTLLDGIVYGRSVFSHSANYRSAVIHGRAKPLTSEDDKLHGLRMITDRMAPGSWEHARRPTKRELAQTSVIALDLAEASVKVRSGPPGDDDEDVAATDAWAGVLPLRTTWGEPEPCPLLPAGRPIPDHLHNRR